MRSNLVLLQPNRKPPVVGRPPVTALDVGVRAPASLSMEMVVARARSRLQEARGVDATSRLGDVDASVWGLEERSTVTAPVVRMQPRDTSVPT